MFALKILYHFITQQAIDQAFSELNSTGKSDILVNVNVPSGSEETRVALVQPVVDIDGDQEEMSLEQRAHANQMAGNSLHFSNDHPQMACLFRHL